MRGLESVYSFLISIRENSLIWYSQTREGVAVDVEYSVGVEPRYRDVGLNKRVQA